MSSIFPTSSPLMVSTTRSIAEQGQGFPFKNVHPSTSQIETHHRERRSVGSTLTCKGKSDEIALVTGMINLKCADKIQAALSKAGQLSANTKAGDPEVTAAFSAYDEVADCYFKEGKKIDDGQQEIAKMTSCLGLAYLGEAYSQGIAMHHTNTNETEIIEKQEKVGQVYNQLKKMKLVVPDLETSSKLSMEADYQNRVGPKDAQTRYRQLWDKAEVKEFNVPIPYPFFPGAYSGQNLLKEPNTKVTLLKPSSGVTSKTPLVIVAPGRAESMKYYLEMAGEFVDEGCAVAVLGFSGNGDIGETGDVIKFEYYGKAVAKMVEDVNSLAGYAPEDIHIVGHSTGGHGVMDAYVQGKLNNVKTISLTAPLLGLPMSGFMAGLGKAMVNFQYFFGSEPHKTHMDTPENWFGDGDFNKNTYTQSLQRFNFMEEQRLASNQTAPTQAWAVDALQSTGKLQQKISDLHKMKENELPKFDGLFTIYTGTADSVVDTGAIKKAVTDMKKAGIPVESYDIKGGMHCLLHEADPYRKGVVGFIHNGIKHYSNGEAAKAKKAKLAADESSSRPKRSARMKF